MPTAQTLNLVLVELVAASAEALRLTGNRQLPLRLAAATSSSPRSTPLLAETERFLAAL